MKSLVSVENILTLYYDIMYRKFFQGMNGGKYRKNYALSEHWKIFFDYQVVVLKVFIELIFNS